MDSTEMVAPSEDVLDFSEDTAVEARELTFTITNVETVASKPNDNGQGTYLRFTFQSPDLPFDVRVRRFISYAWNAGEPTKDQSAWLARERGGVKRIAIAAIPDGNGKFSTVYGNPLYIIGRQLLATTVPDDQDRLTLGRFKAIRTA